MPNYFIIHLSKKQKKRLKIIFKKGQNRVSRRAHMILLNNKGYTIDQISDICMCDRDTVSKTLNCFRQENYQCLYDKNRTGAPRILTNDDEKYLFSCLQKSPMEFGYFATVWTLAIMACLLQEKRNKAISQPALKELLRKRNWQWNRPKQIPPTCEPIVEEEKQEILRLLKFPRENEVLLFQDEMDLELLPRITGAWMPRGQQMKIPTPGKNKITCIFGFFNPHNKDFYYKMVRTRKKKTAKNFIAALHQIRTLYRRKKIHIIVDNASIHMERTKLLLRFREIYSDEIIIHFLPKRCPNLNAIERFWNFCKLRVASNWFYETQDNLERAFRRFIWHYRQREIAYNFDLRKLIRIWEKHPTLESVQQQNNQEIANTA